MTRVELVDKLLINNSVTVFFCASQKYVFHIGRKRVGLGALHALIDVHSNRLVI